MIQSTNQFIKNTQERVFAHLYSEGCNGEGYHLRGTLVPQSREAKRKLVTIQDYKKIYFQIKYQPNRHNKHKNMLHKKTTNIAKIFPENQEAKGHFYSRTGGAKGGRGRIPQE